MTRHPVPPASHQDPNQPLAQLAHAALRNDEQAWRRLRFLGLRIGQRQLFEDRGCPDCGSVISQPTDGATAIAMLIGRLRAHDVPDVLLQSVRTLTDWLAAPDKASLAEPEKPLDTRLFVRIPIGTPLAEAERQIVVAALDCCGGNRSESAKLLGLSRRTLYNKLQSLKRRKLLTDPLPPARVSAPSTKRQPARKFPPDCTASPTAA